MNYDSAAEAVKRLFHLYKDEVYQYARFVTGSPTEAEDIVQEVFLRVLRSWNKYNKLSSERTWLWAIVRNTVKDFFRKRNRDKHVSFDEIQYKGAYQTTDGDLLIDLERSLCHLTFPQKQVFVLRIVQDKPSSEVAKLLGWSEIKVRVMLYRATKKIYKILSNDYAMVNTVLEGEDG